MVSAEALFADLRRASDPDPEAYDNAAYEALRKPRAKAGPREPVRVIAIRRTVAPDWVAVARALPNFRGHLQPRLPADGFSDPADPATLRRDVALAERYGLFGFCHEVASVEAAGNRRYGFPVLPRVDRAKRTRPSAASPALASPHAIRIDGRPVLLLPAGRRSGGVAQDRGAVPDPARRNARSGL